MKKEIGIIGLGKMGLGMAERLEKSGYRVIGYNRSEEASRQAAEKGVEIAGTVEALTEMVGASRMVILAVPHLAVDQVLQELTPYLTEDDIVIDGANAFYRDSVRRYEKLKEQRVNFIDMGVSGGPEGARRGACLMIGGDHGVVERCAQLFEDLSVADGWRHVGASGAGHFVKMVHNGIEYGMMQSLAEGFTILKQSEYNLSLTEIADLYNHGSVIESRLVGWLEKGLEKYGEGLGEVSGVVSHSGMGEWAVEVGKELEVETPAISSAYMFRINSEDYPSFTGKLLTLIRGMFGGHRINKE